MPNTLDRRTPEPHPAPPSQELEARRSELTPEEKGRNNFGPTYIYVHQSHPIAKSLLQIQHQHAKTPPHEMPRVRVRIQGRHGRARHPAPYPP